MNSFFSTCSSPNGWNIYGGDVVMGQVEWSASAGSATFLVTLDPDLSVFGMSFNTTVPASDFVFSTLESGWTYRGVSRAEGIGTDGFDHTLYRSDYGVGNTFSFRVVGAAIATDAGFWESNLAGCHGCENTWAWYTIMHGSHFGVWAADARWYTRPVPLLAPTDPISMRR